LHHSRTIADNTSLKFEIPGDELQPAHRKGPVAVGQKKPLDQFSLPTSLTEEEAKPRLKDIFTRYS
jgi:hypothetical protein